VISTSEYDRLIAKESHHWGEVSRDEQNPQIWHDPALFEIFFGKEYRRLLERASAWGPHILELGCGEGNLSLELATRGLNVTGIDLSEQRIERARSKASALQADRRPRFITGDLNTIALPAASFDCVVAHDSLHHILSLDRLCDEVRKSLRPGGHFVVMDFIGMGLGRKLAAGFLYAILPTYQPYRVKWGLRRRFTAFLASERRKREALADSSLHALHAESPFEEISQVSIVKEIVRRFDVVERETFCPFWYYLIAKLRLPSRVKYPAARFLRSFDDLIVRLHFAKGAYVWLVAQNRSIPT
jgi:2-polyprenyl-3-methyl-5-hydroxy-6-metoxy-1,4-benzoquinol methylase